MENTEKPAQKTVKLTPTSQVYAVFDLIEVEGKQMIAGSIGFKDQFHMERMARTAGEKGIRNLGEHIVAIYAGQIDGLEPDEDTKAALLAQFNEENKASLAAGELQPSGEVDAPVESIDDKIIPFEPEALK